MSAGSVVYRFRPGQECAKSESQHPGGRLPLRLADRFFPAAHIGDDRLEPRVVGERLALGCAAALLAELILDDEIAVHPTVHPSGPERWPDFLAWTVLREVRQGSGRELRGRIEHTGATAVQKVRSRLVLIDVLREVRLSGVLPGGSGTAWQAVDNQVDGTAEVLERLFTDDDNTVRTGMLSPSQRLVDIVLALLARETGVLRQLGLSKQTARQGAAHGLLGTEVPGDLRAVIDELSELCARSSIRSPW